MFSLARGGYAPASFGRVSTRGTPVPALLVSAAGLALAMVIAFFFPDSAFVYLFGISLFGGLFAWLMIFVTHLFFRAEVGCLGPAAPARPDDRLSLHVAAGRGGDGRDSRDHLVGGGHAHRL